MTDEGVGVVLDDDLFWGAAKAKRSIGESCCSGLCEVLCFGRNEIKNKESNL